MGSTGPMGRPHRRLVVGAVLLAAGSGSRLGGRPKCLLELGGVALIRRLLIALSGAGVDEVVVVLGHHAELIAAAVRDLPVKLACNPRPDDGQASSLITGLRALGTGLDAVIVALADQPLLEAPEVSALIAAFEGRNGAAMVVPRVAGQPGNPVMFEAALKDEWLAGPADAAGRPWREANLARVHWFDTDNPAYRIDIDTPDDLLRFSERTGHSLRWPAHLAAPAGAP